MIRIVDDGSVEVTPESVSEIIGATTPVGVRVDQVNAGPVHQTQFEAPDVELVRGGPAFAAVDDGQRVLVRLEHTLTIGEAASSADERSSITVFHLAIFDCAADLTCTPASVSAWIETNVYFIVYPYVRQFFTMMTAEMGLPPVVLGYMHRTEMPYSNDDGSSAEIEAKSTDS